MRERQLPTNRRQAASAGALDLAMTTVDPAHARGRDRRLYEGSYASGGASEGSAEWHGKAAWAWWCCVGSVGAVSGWEVAGEC